jgi:hypothetical protein
MRRCRAGRLLLLLLRSHLMFRRRSRDGLFLRRKFLVVRVDWWVAYSKAVSKRKAWGEFFSPRFCRCHDAPEYFLRRAEAITKGCRRCASSLVLLHYFTKCCYFFCVQTDLQGQDSERLEPWDGFLTWRRSRSELYAQQENSFSRKNYDRLKQLHSWAGILGWHRSIAVGNSRGPVKVGDFCMSQTGSRNRDVICQFLIKLIHACS